MNRWRDAKKNKIDASPDSSKNDTLESNICSPIPPRIKAFIVDMFMIMMPLAYATTYIFMNGKDDFQGSEEARWSLSIIYGLIIIIFWIAKGQNPVLKTYKLKLINCKKKKKKKLFKTLFPTP